MGMPINAKGEIESENLTLAARNAILNMMTLLQERGFAGSRPTSSAASRSIFASPTWSTCPITSSPRCCRRQSSAATSGAAGDYGAARPKRIEIAVVDAAIPELGGFQIGIEDRLRLLRAAASGSLAGALPASAIRSHPPALRSRPRRDWSRGSCRARSTSRYRSARAAAEIFRSRRR